MDKYLSHWITTIIDCFYFLGGDVFSLCQLENVFLSVDDLQSAVLQRTRWETQWFEATWHHVFSTIIRDHQGHSAHYAYRKPFPNVPCVQPSILVYCLSCPIRVIQVSLKYIWSFDTHLVREIERKKIDLQNFIFLVFSHSILHIFIWYFMILSACFILLCNMVL